MTPSKPTNPTAHDGRQVGSTAPDSLSVGQCATLACLLEASIPKPGNVHRGADFEDLSLSDFLVSAAAIGPAMDAAAGSDNLGRTVLRAIQATQHLVSSNTNLGIVLLLAPLASVPRDTSVSDGVSQILDELTAEDAHNVYEAIRIAEPGGLGQVDAMDVAHSPPEDLLAAMRQAADRDLIARQYVNRFEDLFSCCVPWLREDLDNGLSLSASVIHTHVRQMQRFPDTLIARKCGVDVAQTAATRAAAVVNSGQPGDEAYHAALSDLDFWLRSDGHRRNPGTTADFIAAGLFVLLRDGHLKGPSW